MPGEVKCVLIGGSPGTGKTTIIKKLIKDLENYVDSADGFYTEEVRNDWGTRIGFDVVTLDGKREILARLSKLDTTSRPKVGRYTVYLENFEKLVLPIFSSNAKLLFVDEIGKMELLSTEFKSKVLTTISNTEHGNQCVIATIANGMSLKPVDYTKIYHSCSVYPYDRDYIYMKILEKTKTMLQSMKNEK